MKLKGQGKPKPTGGNGDLIVIIKVSPHKYFNLDGKNVLVDVPVTFCEAALGEKVEVPTPDGKKVRIKVPAGTKSGAKLTIKGAGLKQPNKEAGNLIAKLKIVVPESLTDEQKDALKKYSEVETKEVRQW